MSLFSSLTTWTVSFLHSGGSGSMPSIPTILCSPTLVDWNSYHKFHRHMKPHLSNNYLNLLLPSQTHGGGASTSSIASYLLVNWHFRHTFHEKHINPPLQQLIALLVLPPPFFFSTSAPSPFLHASPPRIYLFTQPGLQEKKIMTHPIEPWKLSKKTLPLP